MKTPATAPQTGQTKYKYRGFIHQVTSATVVSVVSFVSVKGTGYTRVDIRRDRITGKMYVLEVNAQCGISEDENYTSIGAILKFSGKTFTELVKEIIENAILKNKLTQQSAKLNEGP